MKDQESKPYLKVDKTGYELLADPILNKDLAFTEEERSTFGLHGLLPPRVLSLEQQRNRCYHTFLSKGSNLEKHLYLCDLQNSNETLFYNLIIHHIEEMMPIIYTPVVGESSLLFSHIYHHPRGLFLSYPHKKKMEEILSSKRFDKTQVIVVTDGERVLGLGDQGAGGMAISTGKLSLYTACAGIHPDATLPILLDTGTDNQNLLNDPAYVGWRHERIRGKEYDEFIEHFVHLVKKRFPHALLHFEDFAQGNAHRILHTYREKLLCFNDDIQGTAAVAVGALLAAIPLSGTPLTKQKIIIVGAGSAGCGIAHLMKEAMKKEGLSDKESRKLFFLIDREGLIKEDTPGLLDFQKPFAQDSDLPSFSLLEAIEHVHPTLLIGVSGQGGLFTQEIVQRMAAHVRRPIIFPLSNPTCKSEAAPSDLLHWTGGRAIIGTGSPFPPLLREDRHTRVDQTNNAYIFPGLGLGALAAEASTLTDEMFLEAALALSHFSSEENILPPLTRIREVSFQIALSVARKASSESEENLRAKIAKIAWEPTYPTYKKA